MFLNAADTKFTLSFKTNAINFLSVNPVNKRLVQVCCLISILSLK